MRGKGGVLTFTRLVRRASIGGINPKVRDLGRSDASGIVRVGIHQIAKYGIIGVGFRGRGQRHRSVVSPTSHCPGMRAKPESRIP